MYVQFKIRQLALLGLGQLYKSVTSNEAASQSDLDKIIWVRDKVFHAYYQNNPDDRCVPYRVVNTQQ